MTMEDHFREIASVLHIVLIGNFSCFFRVVFKDTIFFKSNVILSYVTFIS